MESNYSFQHLSKFLRGFERFLRGAPFRNGAADRAGMARGQVLRDPGIADKVNPPPSNANRNAAGFPAAIRRSANHRAFLMGTSYPGRKRVPRRNFD